MTRAAIARICGAVVALMALTACGDAVRVEFGADASEGSPSHEGTSRTPGDPSVIDDSGSSSFRASEGGVGDCTQPGVLCIGGPVSACPASAVTTLTGTVFDPAGKNPVYDAVVFIPQDTVPPIASGASTCSPCYESIGDYVAATTTDATGAFRLDGVPSGRNIPLVVQAGKWRRQVTLPNVVDCQTAQVPAELTRLPRNQTEGDIPQMAVLTGACDGIACFLRRVGLDAQEFTGPDGGGRLHVYRGVGPGPDLVGGGGGTAGDCTSAARACPLWTTKAQLERYDVVLLGCECGENNQTKPDMTPMHDWLDEGGRVIAVHDQETWFENGPADFQSIASWTPAGTDASAGSGALGPFTINSTFLKGQIFKNWLTGTGALAPDGTIPLDPAHVNATIAGVAADTNGWVYSKGDGSSPTGSAGLGGDVEYMSFGTPVGGTNPAGGAPSYCARSVVTDVHVGASAALANSPVPASCGAGDLSAEEKALEFLFFDSIGCVNNTTTVKGLPPL